MTDTVLLTTMHATSLGRLVVKKSELRQRMGRVVSAVRLLLRSSLGGLLR
jgi:hypothetical protein